MPLRSPTGERRTIWGIYFARFCFRGQRREDLERLYFDEYLPRAEHVPRLRGLPDSLLVHARELFTEEERKTSATYNEGMRLSDTRNSLNVRLDGPGRNARGVGARRPHRRGRLAFGSGPG